MFPARIKGHFYSIQNTFRPKRRRFDVKRANKQAEVQIRQRLPEESSSLCSPSFRCSAQLLFVDCKLRTNNKEHQFCSLFSSELGWKSRGNRSNVRKWQPKRSRKALVRKIFASHVHHGPCLQPAADATCRFLRRPCCHHLIGPPGFTPVSVPPSVNEAFKRSGECQKFHMFLSYMLFFFFFAGVSRRTFM